MGYQQPYTPQQQGMPGDAMMPGAQQPEPTGFQSLVERLKNSETGGSEGSSIPQIQMPQLQQMQMENPMAQSFQQLNAPQQQFNNPNPFAYNNMMRRY